MKTFRAVVVDVSAQGVSVIPLPTESTKNYFTGDDLIHIPIVQLPMSYPIIQNVLQLDAVRQQIPCGLPYCITIDRAMSQTLRRCGIDARRNVVDSPGHWYVSFSRTESIDGMLVLVNAHNCITDGGIYVNNTAYDVIIKTLLKEEFL